MLQYNVETNVRSANYQLNRNHINISLWQSVNAYRTDKVTDNTVFK